MAHNVQNNDNLMMTGSPAWHKLGITVEDAPTPIDGFQRAGLLYDVDQVPIFADHPALFADRRPLRIDIPDRVANIRSDDHTVLGIVSNGYQVIQNRTMAEFCELLAEGDDLVTCESLGSLCGGKKIWCLIRGESFSVRDDEVVPYFCISNGHDGVNGFRGDPTSVRVQCDNTLRLVTGDPGNFRPAGFSFRHVGDVKQRLDEAKAALGLYNRSLARTRELATQLASKPAPDCTKLGAFFQDAYQLNFGTVPVAAIDEQSRRAVKRWGDAHQEILRRWNLESQSGSTMWAAFNAYTGWLQHDRPRIKKADRLAHTNLLGTNAERTHQVLQLALAS